MSIVLKEWGLTTVLLNTDRESISTWSECWAPEPTSREDVAYNMCQYIRGIVQIILYNWNNLEHQCSKVFGSHYNDNHNCTTTNWLISCIETHTEVFTWDPHLRLSQSPKFWLYLSPNGYHPLPHQNNYLPLNNMEVKK